jgi:hypothetical protein
MKLFSLNTKFPFGKYKGKTLSEVSTLDLSYISWCLLNIETFIINPEIYKELKYNFSDFEFTENVELIQNKKLKIYWVNQLINNAFKKLN